MIRVIMANSEQNTAWNVIFLPKIGCKINFGPLLTLIYLQESAAEKTKKQQNNNKTQFSNFFISGTFMKKKWL